LMAFCTIDRLDEAIFVVQNSVLIIKARFAN
jgi:hypothetical protein